VPALTVLEPILLVVGSNKTTLEPTQLGFTHIKSRN